MQDSLLTVPTDNQLPSAAELAALMGIGVSVEPSLLVQEQSTPAQTPDPAAPAPPQQAMQQRVAGSRFRLPPPQSELVQFQEQRKTNASRTFTGNFFISVGLITALFYIASSRIAVRLISRLMKNTTLVYLSTGLIFCVGLVVFKLL